MSLSDFVTRYFSRTHARSIQWRSRSHANRIQWLLRKVELLSEVSGPDLDRLEEEAEPLEIPRRQVIISAGTPATPSTSSMAAVKCSKVTRDGRVDPRLPRGRRSFGELEVFGQELEEMAEVEERHHHRRTRGAHARDP